MAKPIDSITEQKIRESVKIEDVFDDHGCVLHRNGNRGLTCLCPFHEDRELGNFSIDTRRNIFKCFACGASGDWIKAVALFEGYDEKRDFNKILRYGAGLCNIYIDDTEPVRVTKYVPRAPLPPLEPYYWDIANVRAYMGKPNPLTDWMLSLPLTEGDSKRLRNALQLYFVGTAIKGDMQGRVIWWYVNEQLKITNAKFMRYLPNGHRDKQCNPNWMSTVCKIDKDKFSTKACLFGLHLLPIYEYAEVCIVESEKTAVLCSAFSEPSSRIWMACGGKSFFGKSMIQPLIDAGRSVVVYPDYDGYEDWCKLVREIGYDKMTVSRQVLDLHTAEDGDKADIADIMVRLVTENDLTRACALLGVTDEETKENLGLLIDKLDLRLV